MNPAYSAMTAGGETHQSLAYGDAMAHSRTTVNIAEPRLHQYGRLTGDQQHVPTTQQTMYNIPYSHYALLYIDGDGKLGIEVSPSIGGSERAIFTDDVRGRFMRSVAGGPSSYPSGE